MMALPMTADPGNRLGESLSTVQAQVDGLRHLRNWSSQGDQYIVYHNTETYTSYFFKNGVVIKEVFTYNGNKNGASNMFRKFANVFARQDYNTATEDDDRITFYFSHVKVTVSIEHFIANEYLCKITYTAR